MKKNKTFSHFIISYVVLILSVSVLQYFLLTHIFNVFSNNAVRIIDNSLENSVKLAEQQMDQMKNIGISVAQNKNLKKFFDYSEGSKAKYKDLVGIRETLSSYQQSDIFIDDISICNFSTDMIIDFNSIYTRSEMFYKTSLASYGDNKLSSESLRKLSGFANGDIKFMNTGRDVVAYAIQTPAVQREKTGNVTIYKDRDKLFAQLTDIAATNNGHITIFDKDGKIIYRNGEYKTKKSNYAFSYNGNCSEWNYLIEIPKKSVTNITRTEKLFCLVLWSVILLFGFFMCVWMALRKSKSYKSLLDILGLKTDDIDIFGNEFEHIKPTLNKLKTQSDISLNDGKQNVLRRLIEDEYKNIDELYTTLEKYEIPSESTSYNVLLIKCKAVGVNPFRENNFRNFIYSEIKSFDEGAMMYYVGKGMLAIILCGTTDEKRVLFISKLENELFLQYDIQVIYTIGKQVDKIEDVHISYATAYSAMEYRVFTGFADIKNYADLPKDENNYFFPKSMEKRLLECISENNYEGAKLALDKIYEENFVKQRLCLGKIKELLMLLIYDMKRVASESGIAFENIHGQESLEKYFAYIGNFIYIVCNRYSFKNENRGELVCNNVSEYIENHFDDVNISLTYLAEKFNMNSSYLSNIFKKYYSVGLSEYIENVRIKKASEFLLSGKYSVKDAARKAGFTSETTFRRTFRKIKGKSPSEYAKTSKADNDEI